MSVSAILCYDMRMSYGSVINETFSKPYEPELGIAIPGEQLEQALDLYNSPLLPSLSNTASEFLAVSDLSEEDRRLFNQRVIAGLAIRLAIGSSYAHLKARPIVPFFELSDTDQAEILDTTVGSYCAALALRLEENGLSLSGSLSSNALSNFSHQAADPLDVPHRFVRHQIHSARLSRLSGHSRIQQIKRYVDVRPGSLLDKTPAPYQLGTNDSLLVQAFGRNSITDKELPTVRKLYDDTADRDDVRMWAVLDGMSFDPGISNQKLADIVSTQLSTDAVIEPIIQWEAAYALWKQDAGKYERYKNYIHTVWPKSDFYPTYEVKHDSVKIMDIVGLYAPRELAHPDMLIRAVAILRKLGVEADPVVADIPYDKRSVQTQARGPMPWTIRETATRLEHILRRRVKF